MAEAKQYSFPFVALQKAASRALAALRGTPAPIPLRPAVRVSARWEQKELCFADTPSLFVHEGARKQLEARLEQLFGERVSLTVTDNRRTMISASRKAGTQTIRLHHMFLEADAFTLRALVRYLKSPRDRSASSVLGGFIEAHRQRIAAPRERTVALRTGGATVDLSEIFDDVNRRYFGGLVDAQITWGKRPSGRTGKRRRARKRRTIKLGSYCPELKLIRIHPALDSAEVPRYFVEYVVFHEMLHHVVPMPVKGGRRECHSPEFKARERMFEHFERAERWEKRHIEKLLK